MQKYEVMIVFKPLLFEDIKNNSLKKILQTVEKMSGTLTEVDNLGKRLLAYPIKSFKEGYYVEYELDLDPSQSDEFSRQLNLLQDVLRFLVIKKEV